MAYRNRAARRPRRRMVRRRNVLRRSLNPMPVFTETWAASPIVCSTGTVGGVLNMTASSLPQMPDYSKLYRQFRILKLQWILVPTSDSVDANTILQNGALPIPFSDMGRFVYAINSTAGIGAPANELEVLTDNGCKILTAVRNKPIRINHVPVPDLSVSAPSAFFSTYMNKKRTWLNTNAVGNNGDGLSVVHGGVNFFCTIGGNAPTQYAFAVYCKTTIQFKDPA